MVIYKLIWLWETVVEIINLRSFIKIGKKEWIKHVKKMTNGHLPKIVCDNNSRGERIINGPPKRWKQSRF